MIAGLVPLGFLGRSHAPPNSTRAEAGGGGGKGNDRGPSTEESTLLEGDSQRMTILLQQ